MSNGGCELDLDVRVRAGDFNVGAALTVPAGQTLALLGPSGSGKSTVLRAIAGLVRPTFGTVRLGERLLFDSSSRTDVPPWKRRIGMVFQDEALFPHLTVLQNIAFGIPSGCRDRLETARGWLRAMGLDTLQSRRPAELSGGQQQRTALARAAAAGGDLLLLDEPFGSLDPARRDAVRGELLTFLRKVGRTALLVTHDPLDALVLATQVAVIEDGEITHRGDRQSLVTAPPTAFLASAAGRNLLEGRLTGRVGDLPGSTEWSVTVGEHVWVVPLAAGMTPSMGQRVLMAFRPEDVTLARGGGDPGSAHNRIQAVVTAVVPMADRDRIHLTAETPLVADVLRSSTRALALEPGSRVLAIIKSTAIHVYL